MFNALIDQLRSTYRTVYRSLKRATTRAVPLIDEALWRQATEHYYFVRRLSKEENRRLRLIASDFLSRKTFTGAAEFEITALMQVQVAAQASILILELGVSQFDGWSEIIIYPGKFAPKREVTDHAGVVHTTRDALSGEAWLGGPVVLSYEDVASLDHQRHHYSFSSAYNVVIHEFAHKLDMRNGDANGFPPLHKGMSAVTWKRDFMAAYLDFCKRVDYADEHADDYEHLDNGASLNALPMDPYGSESPAEFFAVASETFFERPESLATGYPAVYAQLKAFYKQDPQAQ
jgi:MtfA peptidase